MGQKVLILHSASIKRVEQGICDIVERGLVLQPEITVFTEDHWTAIPRWRAHAAVNQVLVRERGESLWHELTRWRRARFAVVVVFVTGEPGYRKMKLLAPLTGAPRLLVCAGDGEILDLTPAAYVRRLPDLWRKRPPADAARFQDAPVAPPPKRIFVCQSAAPEVIAAGIRRLLAQNIFRSPEITVFIREKAAQHPVWQTLGPSITFMTHGEGWPQAPKQWGRLRAAAYDAVVVFLTGDPSYRKMKSFAFALGIRRLLIFNEHLDCFFYAPGPFLRFLTNRCLHGVAPSAVLGTNRPTIPERILVLQSAEPEVMAPILETLSERELFYDPQLTLFLRNEERYRAYFADKPYVKQLQMHTRMANAWAHLRRLRGARYDAVILFLTGDPSYWKMKYFAFLCGARRLLIFNENLDCFFFTPRAFLRFLLNRWRRAGAHASPPLSVLAKILRPLIFPFRFAYLLLYFLVLQMRRPR